MSVLTFFSGLFIDGRIQVPAFEPLLPNDEIELTQQLAAFERQWRDTLAGTPPEFDPAAALWAATRVLRAAQFITYRELGVELMEPTLAVPAPRSDSVAADYNVDLTLRFLPDLARLAKRSAEQDPLLSYFDRWANDWPLSSVGYAGARPRSVAELLAQPALRTLYVDRIFARQDASRLSDPAVREYMRQVLGAFPELADADWYRAAEASGRG